MERLPRMFVSDEELKKYLYGRLWTVGTGGKNKHALKVLEGLVQSVVNGDNGTREFTLPDATVIIAEFPQLSRVLGAIVQELEEKPHD